MSALSFSKMHGLGNDFIVINALKTPFDLSPAEISALGHRKFGIGFDQLLIIENSQRDDCEFKYRIMNATGEEVEHCGNGARCFARYVIDHGLSAQSTISVETAKGLMLLRQRSNGHIEVDFGQPNFDPQALAFSAAPALEYSLVLSNGQRVDFAAVSIGNPHITLQVADVESYDVAGVGAELEQHSAFANNVNVGFLQLLSRRHGKLRVFERSVGETLACGTGACAAMVNAHRAGLVEDHLDLELLGGSLSLHWNGQGSIIMQGPATHVFDGVVQLER